MCQNCPTQQVLPDLFILSNEPMIQRLVHLLMVAIIITCPIRCMVQGCGCYSDRSITQGSDASCCCKFPADSNSEAPGEPCETCKCSCFCAGATIPDVFVVTSNMEWVTVFISDHPVSELVLLCGKPSDDAYRKPPNVANNGGNIGRATRQKFCSLVI
ncbi:MAG: hypothetical protein AB8B55_22235 [Mariniblastus sp.]